MKFLIPVVLLIIGTAAGGGAGFLLKPDKETESDTTANDTTGQITCAPGEMPVTAELAVQPIEEFDDGNGGITTEPEYVPLEKQFVVPVIADEKLIAMMVLSVAVSVPPGQSGPVTAAEPRLRDRFLQVMFNHANIGGFSGNFTSNSNMQVLRQDLLRAARDVIGTTALDILVLDIIRQDT